MIIVIVGPTGVGKTKLSVELAKRLDAEIVNADSMQVFKGLDIATAKIAIDEKEGISHHLFDIKEVEDNYTVFDYQKDLREKIKELKGKNKNIIIVGGTGLYIKAGLYNYKFDYEEEKLDYSNFTLDELVNKIKSIDSSIEIDFSNRRRVERVLTKLLNNSDIENDSTTPLYDFKIVGLTTDRDNLYRIIDKRVDKMVKDGLIKEAKYYYDKGIRSKAIMTGIGYKELYKYFDDELSLDDAIDLIKKNSRHYAKRQYTFFNHQMDVKWFNTNYDDFSKTVDEVYKYIND